MLLFLYLFTELFCKLLLLLITDQNKMQLFRVQLCHKYITIIIVCDPLSVLEHIYISHIRPTAMLAKFFSHLTAM